MKQRLLIILIAFFASLEGGGGVPSNIGRVFPRTVVGCSLEQRSGVPSNSGRVFPRTVVRCSLEQLSGVPSNSGRGLKLTRDFCLAFSSSNSSIRTLRTLLLLFIAIIYCDAKLMLIANL